MKLLKKNSTDNAVVGVITAILLIGLIVAVISLVQTMYIPKIMEQRESEHMDKVAEQFTYLTSVVDGQAANPSNNMPIATSITLGSKELPYMLSIKAFGTLEILDNARSITVTTSTESETFPIGVITYSSKNAYFLDQNYTYEAGAMIVSQSDGSQMMIRPDFDVKFITPNTLNIVFDVINIQSVGGKTIASGFATYPIQTEFHDDTTNVTFTQVDYITITTPLSNAWSVYINNTLSSVIPGKYTIPPQQPLKIDFLEPLIVTVIFKIINIQAQIGPGWVQ